MSEEQSNFFSRGNARAFPFSKGEEKGARPLSVEMLVLCSQSNARGKLSYHQAVQLKLLPLSVREVSGRKVLLLAGRENTPELVGAAQFASGMGVKICPVSESLISAAIETAYNRDGGRVSEALSALQVLDHSIARINAVPDEPKREGEVSLFIMRLIEHAYALRSSDIHIEPKSEGSHLRLRVKGELLSSRELIGSLLLHQRLVQRIKVLARLDSAQHVLPQDGAFIFKLSRENIHIRVSIVPTFFGEKVVLRILYSEGLETVADLSFPVEVERMVAESLHRSEGLILVSGATGSGKSTTLYAIARTLSDRGMSVATIEDPIERLVPGTTQSGLNEKSGLTFPVALKAILRQDPDVILIGEIRDAVSAEIAFHAAMTGHLVLTTVHGGNIQEALSRVRELGIAETLAAQSLALVISQKLVSTLCSSCRVFDLESSNEFSFPVYKEVGCAQCGHSGFSGVRALPEALIFDSEVKKNIFTMMSQQECFDAFGEKSYYSATTSLLSALKSGDIPLRYLRNV